MDRADVTVLRVGQRYELGKPAGALVGDRRTGKRQAVSLPAGEIVTIDSFGKDERILLVQWREREALMFRDDVQRAALLAPIGTAQPAVADVEPAAVRH